MTTFKKRLVLSISYDSSHLNGTLGRCCCCDGPLCCSYAQNLTGNKTDQGQKKSITETEPLTQKQYVSKYEEDFERLKSSSPKKVRKAVDILFTKDTGTKAIEKVHCLLDSLCPEMKMQSLVFIMRLLVLVPTNLLDLPTSPLSILLAMPDVNPGALIIDTELAQHSAVLHILSRLIRSDYPGSFENQAIIAEQLIKSGADVNARIFSPGNAEHGFTPLHVACRSGSVTNLRYIKLLLRKGADPNLSTPKERYTPLMLTIPLAMQAAECLMKYSGAKIPIDVNLTTKDDETFLDLLSGDSHVIRRMKLGHSMGMKRMFPPSLFDAIQKKINSIPQGTVDQMLEVTKILIDKGATAGTSLFSHSSARFHFGEASEMMLGASTVSRCMQSFKESRVLSFSVFELIGIKDLRVGGPQWYRLSPFRVDDIHSQFCETMPSKKVPRFLHSGRTENGQVSFHAIKAPMVGQRLIIHARLPLSTAEEYNEIPRRKDAAVLWGRVTKVFDPPLEKKLKSLGSSLYRKKGKNHSRQQARRCGYTTNGTYQELLDNYGFVHGQRVKGIVELDPWQRLIDKYSEFFGHPGTKYEVTLECDDRYPNQWIVINMSLVEEKMSYGKDDYEQRCDVP